MEIHKIIAIFVEYGMLLGSVQTSLTLLSVFAIFTMSSRMFARN